VKDRLLWAGEKMRGGEEKLGYTDIADLTDTRELDLELDL